MPLFVKDKAGRYLLPRPATDQEINGFALQLAAANLHTGNVLNAQGWRHKNAQVRRIGWALF